mmetsp:Transcript_9167/g.20247  ORF Transcript_9167/g.20247 Transcript_9167/m.20247 type:complete len:205 (+) Transcript_9167:477-1091(+)
MERKLHVHGMGGSSAVATGDRAVRTRGEAAAGGRIRAGHRLRLPSQTGDLLGLDHHAGDWDLLPAHLQELASQREALRVPDRSLQEEDGRGTRQGGGPIVATISEGPSSARRKDRSVLSHPRPKVCRFGRRPAASHGVALRLHGEDGAPFGIPNPPRLAQRQRRAGLRTRQHLEGPDQTHRRRVRRGHNGRFHAHRDSLRVQIR